MRCAHDIIFGFLASFNVTDSHDDARSAETDEVARGFFAEASVASGDNDSLAIEHFHRVVRSDEELGVDETHDEGYRQFDLCALRNL